MTTQLHNEGEEFIIKSIYESDVYALPTSVDVGLFHDGEVSGDTTAGDNLADGATLADITTEPDTTTAYGRATVSLDSTGFSATTDANGDWKASNDNTLSFDLSDQSSGILDAWFITGAFDANNDGTAEDVLIVSGNLSQAYDLSSGNDYIDLDPDAVGHNID